MIGRALFAAGCLLALSPALAAAMPEPSSRAHSRRSDSADGDWIQVKT